MVSDDPAARGISAMERGRTNRTIGCPGETGHGQGLFLVRLLLAHLVLVHLFEFSVGAVDGQSRSRRQDNTKRTEIGPLMVHGEAHGEEDIVGFLKNFLFLLSFLASTGAVGLFSGRLSTSCGSSVSV